MTISRGRFKKVLTDFEVLLEDVTSLVNRDDIVKQRISEIKSDPSIGRSEKELDSYLRKRGAKVD